MWAHQEVTCSGEISTIWTEMWGSWLRVMSEKQGSWWKSLSWMSQTELELNYYFFQEAKQVLWTEEVIFHGQISLEFLDNKTCLEDSPRTCLSDCLRPSVRLCQPARARTKPSCWVIALGCPWQLNRMFDFHVRLPAQHSVLWYFYFPNSLLKTNTHTQRWPCVTCNTHYQFNLLNHKQGQDQAKLYNEATSSCSNGPFIPIVSP